MKFESAVFDFRGDRRSRPPRVLLFDLGGVLVDFRGFEALAAMVPDAGGVDAVRERWLASEAVRSFEIGAIGPEVFAERFVTEWRLELSPADFLENFEAWARELYPGALELLAGLRGRYRLACLSNANVLHAALYRPLLAPYLDPLLFSFELGQLKPDPPIFHEVVRRLGVAAHEIVLFDDSVANVEAARAAGMRAELVRGVGALARKLAALA